MNLSHDATHRTAMSDIVKSVTILLEYRHLAKHDPNFLPTTLSSEGEPHLLGGPCG